MQKRITDLLFGKYGRMWFGREVILMVEKKRPGVYDITGTVEIGPTEEFPLAIAFTYFNYVADAVMSEFKVDPYSSVGLSNGEGTATFAWRCYVEEAR